MSDEVGAIFSVLFAILFYGGIIWAIVAVRRNRKKPKPPEKPIKPTPPTPKNDAQKAFVAEVIAAIEREDANFYKIEVFDSSDAPKGVRLFADYHTHRDIYDYDAHGYYISKEASWMLAAQIAEHFGGESPSYSSPYIVYGPKYLAEERENKRRQELERQRIENLRHL